MSSEYIYMYRSLNLCTCPITIAVFPLDGMHAVERVADTADSDRFLLTKFRSRRRIAVMNSNIPRKLRIVLYITIKTETALQKGIIIIIIF